MCGSSWLSNPQYHGTMMYKLLHNPGQKVDWYREIWDAHNVPKYSFIGWLATKNRLYRRDRLHALGISQTDQCLLCINGKEENTHLFFTCSFSRQVLK